MKKHTIYGFCLSLLLCAMLGGVVSAQESPADAEESKSKTVDMPFVRDVPFGVIMTEFFDQTGIRIELHGQMPDEASVSGSAMTPEAVLQTLADAHNLRWIRTPEGEYHLYTADAYRNEYLPSLTVQKIFVPKNVTADYLKQHIEKSQILTPEVGSISIDPRTNQMIIIDLPEALAKVQDLFDLLDVALFNRVFYVRYADLQTVATKIERFKSESGSIEMDVPGRHIIVEDTLQNIQRMEEMIGLLDQRRERIAYNLNSVDLADKEIDNLKTYLELLVSPESKYYVDTRRGLLYLEDTPEVHEQLQEFMRLFTRTMDQVMIYAELLEVRQSSGFNYGTDLGITGGMVKDQLGAVIAANEGVAGFLSGVGDATDTGDLSSGGSTTTGDGGLSMKYVWPLGGNTYATASFSAAMNDSNTRVLLRPRLLIKSGEEARIAAQSSNPLLEPVYDDDGDVTGYNTTFLEAGLFVDLKPTISPTGLIEMQVSIENSDAQEVQIRVGTTESKEADIRDSYTKTEDRVDTTLIIPDGETRVISGLLRKDNSDSESGVPFLYKIPVLGTLLFGRKSAGEETRNLVFFITPVIVREKTSDDLIAYRFDPQEPMPFGSDVEKAPLQKDDAALTSSTASDIFEGVLPMESLSPQQYQDAANLKATGSENSEAALREMFGGKMPATSTEAKILKPGTSATVEAPKGSVSKPAAKPDPAAASGATPQAKPAKSEADNAKKGGDKKPQKKPRTGVGSPNRTTRKP